MRIVLDTNVVVSALIWGGTPYKLLQAAIDGDIILCTSPTLLAEIRVVLARSRLAAKLQQRRGLIEDALSLYAGLTLSVIPAEVPPVVAADPDDDHVIAAAVASAADLIVSGDQDLLRLGEHQGVRILAPAAALALIAVGSD